MLIAALLGNLLVQPVDSPRTFEKLAGELISFQSSEFIYARDPWRMPKSWAASWRHGLTTLRSRAWDEKELIALLKHESAKVRVLALAALFDRQDPSFLPHFVNLLNDDSRHFPEFAVRRAIALSPNKPPPKDDDEPDPQDVHAPTVGDFAKACVRYWLEPAGYDVRDAAAYVAEAAKFPFRSSWHSARLQRVTALTGAGPHFYEARKELFQTFHKQLEALPPKQRDWVLLWVVSHNEHGQTSIEEFLGGREAIGAAGKRLGPELLRKVLRNEVIAGDADLQDDLRCRRLRWPTARYILRRADAWLAPDDADDFKRRYDAEPDKVEWVLAAAALRPDNAATWLKNAIAGHEAGKDDINKSWLRAKLAAGLARVAGEKHLDYLADWYYGEFVPERPSYSMSRQIFTMELNDQPSTGGAKTLACIIRDKRFEETPPYMVWDLAAAVNNQAGRDVTPTKDLSPSFTAENAHDRQRLARVRESLEDWAALTR
jgi:hypothetical protein